MPGKQYRGVRGIRTGMAAGTVVGRASGSARRGKTAAAQQIPLTELAGALAAAGVPPANPGSGGGSSGLVVGTTTISGGTNGDILFDNAGVLGDLGTTGSGGSVVLSNSPTLVTPALGTPTALVLTNATGLPAAEVLSGALVNGMTATTQSPGDNTTKIATDAFVTAAVAAGGGFTLTNEGAWNSTSGYTPGNVVQYNGSSYLCFATVAAPSATAAPFTDFNLMTISTTLRTNDTADSGTGSNGNAVSSGNGKSSGAWYQEFQVTNLVDNGTQIGLCPATGIIAGGGIGYTATGAISSSFSGGGSSSMGSLSAGSRAGLAWNGTSFWFVKDVTQVGIGSTGYWNGISSATPGGGGGVAMGTIPAALFASWYTQSSAGQKCQLFTLPGDFTINGGIPAGFSAQDVASSANSPPTTDDLHWLSQGDATGFIASVGPDFTVTAGGELLLRPRVKPIRSPLDYTPGDELPLANLAISSLDTNVFKHTLLGGL